MMANKEEVYEALDLFFKHRQERAIEEMSRQNMGAVAVVMYLFEKGEAKSIEISKKIGISSARMAVLLKKLEAKGMILKTHSKIDARAITIKLSQKGEKFANGFKEELFCSMEKVVDEIGIDEIKKIVDGLNRISEILSSNKPRQMEDLNA